MSDAVIAALVGGIVSLIVAGITSLATYQMLGNTAQPGGAGGPGVLPGLVAGAIAFFRSGFFFILLGCGFLYIAYNVIYHIHPTFVFILALLGLSIVLFGTGTQSLGTGEFTEPGSQAKAKFYLAGGAGVLAALFGFGAVLGSQQIGGVFADPSGYALVVFDISNPAGSKLQQASVTTSLRDGSQLPVVIRETSIETLAQISRGYGKLDVCIEAKGPEQKWTIEHKCCNSGPDRQGARATAGAGAQHRHGQARYQIHQHHRAR